MLIEQLVETSWNNRTRGHYESKGYEFTKIGDTFKVNVEHLPRRSGVKVRYICEYCGKESKKAYYSLMDSREVINKDCCGNRGCMAEKQSKIRVKQKIERVGSLLDNFPDIASEWGEKNKKPPSDYLSSSNYKVFWVCSKGHEWTAAIYSRTGQGRGCPYCAGQRPTAERNLEVLYPKLAKQWSKRNESLPSSHMPGSNKPIWWVCGKNHEWKAASNNRVAGTGCPICNQSKGEGKVKGWLKRKGISFEQQYEFRDLLSDKGNPLKFDFATMSHSGELVSLIEYDGEFHFSKQYEGDNFERTVHHDRLKNKYCKERGLYLLRIPYYNADIIDEILTKHISDMGLVNALANN